MFHRILNDRLAGCGALTCLTLLAVAIEPNAAQTQSGSFGYTNSRSGMQYSQDYRFRGGNLNSYWSYSPPASSVYSGHGYSNHGYSKYGYAGRSHGYAPLYATPNYPGANYGYQPKRQYGCR